MAPGIMEIVIPMDFLWMEKMGYPAIRNSKKKRGFAIGLYKRRRRLFLVGLSFRHSKLAIQSVQSKMKHHSNSYTLTSVTYFVNFVCVYFVENFET